MQNNQTMQQYVSITNKQINKYLIVKLVINSQSSLFRITKQKDDSE